MRYAFWNINKNSINNYISSLVMDNRINVLILSEYDRLEVSNLMDKLHFNLVPSAGCEELVILSDADSFEMGSQEPRFSIQIVNKDYLLCTVHLASKLFDREGDRRMLETERLLSGINEIQTEKNITEVVFVGDFNEDPYEKSILNIQGFHALPSFKDLDNETRMVESKTYRKFYNPMWNLLGDRDGVPGTFYYGNSSSLAESYWHMLDQVIISKGLYNRFCFKELKIITETSEGPLIKDNGRPNECISDHLPIVFEIGDNTSERF